MSTLQTQLVKKTAIIDSGDFNLSFSRYLENISENKNIVFEKIENLMSVDWGNTNLTKSSYVENGKYAAVSASGADGRINNSEYSKNKVVLSAIGANCGKVFYLNEDFTAIKNTIVFHNYKQSLNPKFLFLFLNSDNRFPKRGSGQPFISKGDVCNVKIPLPSLEIQEQIVKKIEGYQQIIDGCRKVVENYKPVIDIDPSWEIVELGEIITKITDGSHHSPQTIPKGMPYITVKDLSEGIIDFENCKKISRADFEKLVKYGCKPNLNDVLFSKDGTVGKTSIIKQEKDFVLLSSLAIISPDCNRVSPDYLYNYLSTDKFIAQATDNKTGVAIKRIVLKTLKKLKISLPTKEVQEEIVTKLEQEREVIEGNKELIQIYKKKINDKIKELF
jgi:restriction endonuclease S subunit